MSVPDPAQTEWVPLQGSSGVGGLSYLGEWDSGRTYNDGDVVVADDGIAYVCTKQGVTVAPEPWPGAAAPQGAQGPPGPKGDQGVATLVGAPIPWLVATIPPGYREFDGSPIVQATHPILYGLFGPTLPDLRDKFLLGASGSRPVGSTGGTSTHTLTEAEMPAHGHLTTCPPGHNLGMNWNASGASVTFGLAVQTVNSGGAYMGAAMRAENTGGGAAHNNMPPYHAVRWITAVG